mgnify:CR=1 FL=1
MSTSSTTSEEAITSDVIETSVNTDGRKPYDWESKYPKLARNEIRGEAIYIGIILFLSLCGLVSCWCGFFGLTLATESSHSIPLNYIMLYFFSGLLGGVIFGVKYFYRVVARGYWTQDRRYWRIFSPWISSCVSLIIGCMVASGYITADRDLSISLSTCIGFIAGYFADEAVGKMSEVAVALFGSNHKAK